MKKILAIWFITVSILLGGCSTESSESSETFDDSINIETIPDTVSETTSNNEDDDLGSYETIISEEYISEAGGNSAISVLSLTISEDKYFIDNHEILYEDLVAELINLDENAYVKISDEKSTLRAFNKIKAFLEENGILYELE